MFTETFSLAVLLRTMCNCRFQMLSEAFNECLSDAIKDDCCTIAFPCIGGGNLGYDQLAVFRCLRQAVEKISNRHPKKSLEVKFFVIILTILREIILLLF